MFREERPMSNQPQFADTHGNLYLIPDAVPVPPAGGAPAIPSTAIAQVLDNSSTWHNEHDTGTPGTSSGSSQAGTSGRFFQMSFTDNGGERFSNTFAKDSKSNHFCYDLWLTVSNPPQLGQMELDVTQVLGPNKVCFLCIQCSSGSKTWEYTTTPQGKTHWNPSNIKGDPTTWKPNIPMRIRLFTHRDDTGMVYYDGVEFNGVYEAFDPTCKGMSVENIQWAADDLLINFQMNGKGSSGSNHAYAKNLTIYRWRV
jgi:hypothetical protein